MAKENVLKDQLQRLPFFNEAETELLDFFVSNGRLRHYVPKQYVYLASEPTTHMFILLKGRIKILLTNEFSEKIFRVLSPPALFPEIALDGKTYPNTALVVIPSDVVSVELSTLKTFLQEHPANYRPFYLSLALELRRAYRQVKNLSLGDARMRLGAKLYSLAYAHGTPSDEGIQISIPLSATDLAEMCGLARESVSRILGQMKDLHLITTEKRTIKIIDLERLKTWVYTHDD